ncbi:transposase [Ralstonia holmesii]
MDKLLIDDQLWASIESLLPPAKPRRFRYPGRRPLADRIVLTGILLVLKTGIRWNQLPMEMGCGSGVSCWRRLRELQRAGVWDRLHAALLAHVGVAERIDFSRVASDTFVARGAGSL